jgi:hypothetical protein
MRRFSGVNFVVVMRVILSDSNSKVREKGTGKYQHVNLKIWNCMRLKKSKALKVVSTS